MVPIHWVTVESEGDHPHVMGGTVFLTNSYVEA